MGRHCSTKTSFYNIYILIHAKFVVFLSLLSFMLFKVNFDKLFEK